MNTQYFNKKQVEAGEMDAFLKALRSQDYGDGEWYNDVHIRPTDCGDYAVEWAQLRWQNEEDTGFEYVDSEHTVMLEKEFPDDTFGYFMDEADYNEQLEKWLESQKKKGLVWKRNRYGQWYEEGEQKKWRETLDRQHDKGAPADDVPEEFA